MAEEAKQLEAAAIGNRVTEESINAKIKEYHHVSFADTTMTVAVLTWKTAGCKKDSASCA